MTTAKMIAEPKVFQLLVVDEEPAIVRMLNFALCQMGFSVLTATSGLEAIGLYDSAWRSIDLVLLDVCMPRPDGPQTLAALRQINPHVRCCFMSGNIGQYSAARLLAMGAVHVFAKPFMSLAALSHKLRMVVDADSMHHARLPESPGSFPLDANRVDDDLDGLRLRQESL